MIHAVARIVRLLTTAPARDGRTKVLAIDGPSGSGKTTLSLAVQAALDAPPPIVHLEDFYPGWDGLADVVPRLVEWVLEPLARGESAGYRRYDWDLSEFVEWHPVPLGALLIVEGVGAGSLPCAPYLSLLVYLDAPEPVRFERAMARSRDGEIYRPYWDRWARQERRLFAEHDPAARADLVLTTTVDDDPGVGEPQDPGVL
jgi:uridine kinase